MELAYSRRIARETLLELRQTESLCDVLTKSFSGGQALGVTYRSHKAFEQSIHHIPPPS